MKKGILYGIGVGPGDPELMTLKAVKLIKTTDIIILPGKERDSCVSYQIAAKAIEKLEEKEYEMVWMPMTKEKEVLQKAHEEAAERIERYLDEGKTAAFLTLGDPCIYSTFAYLQQLIQRHGYQTKLVSGVTSFCAAAAALNTALVVKDEALHIFPATYALENSEKESGTKVLMKSGKSMELVKEALRTKKCSVQMVENCGMEEERIYLTLEDIPENSSYYSLIVVKNAENK